MPSSSIISEIDRKVDMGALERGLMKEGIRKFAEPQRALLRLIAQKRASLLARGYGSEIESARMEARE